jgi:hypothetical protein
MIIYIQHYGVLRAPSENIGAKHAWNHNWWLTNCITLKLTHRSDHHMNVFKRYYAVRCDSNARYLPACYFVMFVAALFPPILRWVKSRHIARRTLDHARETLVPH